MLLKILKGFLKFCYWYICAVWIPSEPVFIFFNNFLCLFLQKLFTSWLQYKVRPPHRPPPTVLLYLKYLSPSTLSLSENLKYLYYSTSLWRLNFSLSRRETLSANSPTQRSLRRSPLRGVFNWLKRFNVVWCQAFFALKFDSQVLCFPPTRCIRLMRRLWVRLFLPGSRNNPDLTYNFTASVFAA